MQGLILTCQATRFFRKDLVDYDHVYRSSGACEASEPGISRFRFVFAPRNDARKKGRRAVNVKATLRPMNLARACAECDWRMERRSPALAMEMPKLNRGPCYLYHTSSPRW